MILADVIDLEVAKLVAKDSLEIHAAAKPYTKIVNAANDKLQKQLSKFERGKIDSDKFLNTTQSILSEAYEKAFLKGSGRKIIPPNGKEWLDNFKASQFKFLENFASAIDEGSTVMSTSQRMGMYANAIRSSYWSGSVVGSGKGSQFDWVTTAGENCDDCLEIEKGNPYARNDLPTVPGAGDTRCGSNCNCHIVRSE